jgi:NhaA family Na+:H+ antiporter
MQHTVVDSSGTSTLLQRITHPFERFIHAEVSGGLVLLACALVAIVWANSPFGESYHHLWEVPVVVRWGSSELAFSLHHWINDGLMVIFFLVVGLEIKRELLVGELSSLKKAALPVIAALGGMVVPAAIYAVFNYGGVASSGWGIPMATDIAFALGVVVLLGKRVPLVLKVFLTALAIADDLGAVVVIAVFYTAHIQGTMLIAAGVFFAIALIGNALGVRSVMFYLIVGVVLWWCVLQSGVHATIAGVLLAIAVPARQRINADDFTEKARFFLSEFAQHTRKSPNILANQAAQNAVRDLECICENVQTPLSRFENNLHAWVAFGIMPLFALANAGVSVSGDILHLLTEPVTIGIILGLSLGKPLGITLFCWIAQQLRWVQMPEGVRWKDIVAIGCIAGIGFTMSLFVQGLAFTRDELVMEAKVGIILASIISTLCGYILFQTSARRSAEEV